MQHFVKPVDCVAGGEGGILLPPFLLSRCDAYTSVITRCLLEGYKGIRSSDTVSIVSLIRWSPRKTVSVVSVTSVRARETRGLHLVAVQLEMVYRTTEPVRVALELNGSDRPQTQVQ